MARINSCTHSLITNPDNFTALALRGVLQDMVRSYDLALWDFNILIEKQPHVLQNYLLRAYTFCNMGKFNLANMDLQKALNIKIIKNNVQGIQTTNIPQLICYLAAQRAKVLHKIEEALKKEQFKEKYSFYFDISLT